jgi:NTP pyrophosphatase (non-canonical NTP hydrolase)
VEKVKLPREVAEAIREFERCGDTRYDLMCAVLGNGNSKSATELRQYVESDDCAFNTLIQALANGYEVEETPEDKVREYFKRLDDKAKIDAKMSSEYSVRTHETFEIVGILTTLKMLNIKIEGVNS